MVPHIVVKNAGNQEKESDSDENHLLDNKFGITFEQ